MAAAVALSNYQLGDILGRGASGSVYRALNFLTGETVAIKSISLLSLPPSSLPDIMSEIDLLKNLNHPNIVKYKGFARDKENLFIVLEYCENGSLQSILKKFGKFPESLIAVYISQVLEGLIYLHEQGVIHRDIKGANILTNKDGSVKLADFGVSSKNQPKPTSSPSSSSSQEYSKKEDNDNEVVGSPYWMAPEVIEQNGSSTASDIWSVGCVIVELLEGKPPYGDLAPMQALWRIVQDESMRIPDGASPIVKDFLYHCFQKDPNLRVSAKKLLRHPWMMSVKKSAEPPVPPVLPKSTPSSRPQSLRAKKPMTVYDEAVQRVQEWNEALNGARLPLPQPRKQSVSNVRQRGESNGPLGPGLFALPSRSSGDAISSQLHPGTGLPIPISQPGLIGKNLHVSDVLNRAKESEGDAESWDDDFAADITLSKKLGHRRDESAANEDLNQKTLRPTKSPAVAINPLPPLSSQTTKTATNGRSASAGQIEDYSDIGLDEDESGLETKLKNLKLKSNGRRGLMHPDDIHKVPLSPVLPTQRSLSTPAKPSLPVPVTPSPRAQARSPPSSRQNSLRGKNTPGTGTAGDNSPSLVELNKYMERDEDYDDIFEGVQPSQASGSKLQAQSLQLTRRSNVSWASDEADEEQDPFAEIEDDFVTEDLEAILLRDKRATLHANVNKLVEGLTPNTPHGLLKDGCDELLSLLENTSPEMGLEAHFVAQHGMLAILEVLESRLTRDIAVRLLRLVNLIVMSDLEMLESFCLIGGIPVIIPYTSKKHSLETRLEASIFIQQLTSSALTLQMFISCRGLRILVELLDEDYALNKTLVLSSLEGISSVFDLQSPTPKPDFVRMFVREGILDPLSTALLSILRDDLLKEKAKGIEQEKIEGQMEQEELETAINRTVSTLLLFCQVAQGDRRVQDGFANRGVMTRILKACDLLSGKSLVLAIKAIKHLATSTQLIEVVQNSNGIEILVGILARNMKGSHASETVSNLFQTIYSMTKLSKSRQEEAASSGIIPLLKKVVQSKSQMSDFALPILCDLANAGKVSRRLLWRYDGLNLYLDLLSHPYWQVSALDAILTWMQDETARVEDVLLEKSASDSLVKCFVQASGVSFEGILDPLIKIIRLSTSLTSSISHPQFYTRLSETLEKSTHAAIKLNLLRLTRVVCDTHPDRQNLVIRFGLKNVIERLGKQDSAILVRELAKEVLPGLLFGNDSPDPIDLANLHDGLDNGDGGQTIDFRSGADRGTMKRTMSQNVISSDTFKNPQSSSSSSPSTVRSMHSISNPPSSSSSLDKSTHQRMTLSCSSTTTLTRSQIDSRNMPPPPIPTPSPILPSSGGGERPKHKRKISRNQLREVQWQTDENGKVRSVRTPSKLVGYTVD
ncbi:STE/STE11/CDC15 protein kinase [Kwoniella mangroviensis CBS 10435]|uniref:non-specific serine/threonine protein kinase n=1 Tax=Kwoniella mangroviensis CBS 10435 TaxID=1331196 RepID=A0A1B9J3J1_9TREE|nr:STE/STE11/CDC15 protein kinase [Kwoniella mangroviensis CBS 10435]